MRDYKMYIIIALAILMGVFLVLWLRKSPTPPVSFQPRIDSLNAVHKAFKEQAKKTNDSLLALHRQDSLRDVAAQKKYAVLVEKLKEKKEEIAHYTCLEVANSFQDFTDENTPPSDTVSVTVSAAGDSVSTISPMRMRNAVNLFVEGESYRMQTIALKEVVAAKTADNNHLMDMNNAKDGQLAVADLMFNKAMALNDEQAKALKKEQRKAKWLKAAAVGEAVIILGIGIGVAIGL